MVIALFGTSADPPTLAHQALLVALAQRCDRVAVWAANNPFKLPTGHGVDLTHRQAMLKVLVDSLQTIYPHLELWMDLSDRRSLISVERAQARWGSDQVYGLAIGADLIFQIGRWYEVKTLLQKVILLIFPRPGYALTPAALQELQRLGARYEFVTPELTPGQAPFCTTPPSQAFTPPISSSGFRQTQDLALLPPAIAAYIQHYHLYGV